jgi:hypothetical protein
VRLKDTRALLGAAKVHFETLIRLYYLRHGFEACDGYMIQFLAVMAFLSQNELNSLRVIESSDSDQEEYLEDILSSLILAAKGIFEQSKCFYLGRSLLYVVHGRMTVEDASLFYVTAKIDKGSIGVEKQRALNSQALFPVNVRTLVHVSEQQRLSNMVREFAKLGVEVDGDGEEPRTTDSSARSSSQ